MDELKDIRSRNWFYLENNLIDRTDLNIYDKMAYSVLARHSNGDGISFPSYKTIALKMGCSERKAKETIANLILKMLIKKENRCDAKNNAFTSNIYLLKDVPSAPEAQALVHDMHYPSAPDAQPLVHHVHPPSAPRAHKGNSFKETNLKETNISIYSVVIDYLNVKAGTKYKPLTSQTKAFIDARVNDGFALEDFKSVIDIKAKEWLGTDFEKYLRPATLFSNKFEGYLNQKKGAKVDGSNSGGIKQLSEWERSELEKARRLSEQGDTNCTDINF